jgi:uncharacterized protein
LGFCGPWGLVPLIVALVEDPSSHPEEMMTAFTEEEFETLADWLLRRGKGIWDIIELEGFLTAIVIGPNTLAPLCWLPKVCGAGRQAFRDVDEINRLTALVMDFHNSIVLAFEANPKVFAPTFFQSKAAGDTVRIAVEWCAGFLNGMRLDPAGWEPLKHARPELLKPIELFGTRAGWSKLEAGGKAEMHATWSPRIAPAVRDIHDFWLPHRREASAATARGAG